MIILFTYCLRIMATESENNDYSSGSDESVEEVGFIFLTQVVVPPLCKHERIPRNIPKLPENNWVGENNIQASKLFL